MKQGKTLQDLGKELERQNMAKRDYLVNTSRLLMETKDGASSIQFHHGHDLEDFAVSDIAHQQIASRLGIPFRYYQKMQKEYPELLDKNVNGWFERNPERRMLRTLDHRLRAFLSDRYRRLDNLELCASVLPVINEMKGASIESCEVTESHLYLKIINKKLKAEVAVGDVVQAGFVVSNSEIGLGSLKVEPLIYRLVCKNGMICKDYGRKKYHVGRQVEAETEAAYELYSDETLKADDKAFFMKVQDIVRCAVDESRFLMTVDKMKEAMHIPLTHDPVQEVELLADTYQLNQSERGNVLRSLFMGRDLSRYGMMNAITDASKLAASYERATDLERIGGEFLMAPVDNKALKAKNMRPMKNVTPDIPALVLAEK